MEAADVERLGRYRPLLVDATNRLWAARGYTLYRSIDDGASFAKVAAYDPGLMRRTAASTRLGTRLFRAGFHCLRVLSSGDVVAVVKGGIVRLKKDAQSWELRHEFRYGSRPLGICLTPSDNLFFGEYWDNPDRIEVRIYGSFDGGANWEVVHRFSKSTIRHVHGIHYDRFRKGCWVLTGDSDSESRILFADPQFSRLDVVASGTQSHRAVTVIPLESGLVVPTDSEHQQNFIQWLDPDSGRLEQIAAVPGTVFYSTVTRNRMLLSTVVEPSTVNLSTQATIWASSDGQDWRQIYGQAKDSWSPVYFQYGTFVLAPTDGPSQYAFAGGQAVERDDQQLLRIAIGDS